MDVLLKGLIGGAMAIAIALASKRGNILPGLLPLFPAFAVLALLIVGGKGDDDGFRQASLSGIKAIPAYLAFLVVCWLAVGRMDFRWAIGCGLIAWAAVALLMFLAPKLLMNT